MQYTQNQDFIAWLNSGKKGFKNVIPMLYQSMKLRFIALYFNQLQLLCR